MKFRKVLAMLLVMALCFSLVSCQGKENDETKTTTQAEQTTEKVENTTLSSGKPSGATDDIGSADAEDITEETSSVTTKPADGTTASSTKPPQKPSQKPSKKPTTPTTKGSKPLLYRVTDKKGNVVWLFGSIHVGRDDFYPLPKYVMNAYNGADVLAVEADIKAFEENTLLQMKLLRKMMYKDRTTIKDHIPKDVYNKAVKILEDNGMYVSVMDSYYPVIWSSLIDGIMIEKVGVKTELGIDSYLLNKAYEDGKKVSEVESAEFQYDMLVGFDDDIQLELLKGSIEQYNDMDKAKEDLDEMMDLWASGNEKNFEEFLAYNDEGLTEEEKDLYQRYNKAMETDRNINMADYAEEALESGKEVFICVGAAHVVGEGAMADLLAERGYKVELIIK